MSESMPPGVTRTEPSAYERPVIASREPLAGLLVPNPSDVAGVPSDVHLKENVLPVRW